MTKTTTILLLLLAAALPAPCRAVQAPDFKIGEILNAPVSKTELASLKGKVVYLDFWATWCAPCVASIPHINGLSDSLKGEPVVFLSVTDETAGQIRAFLKTHEMKSWVCIDGEKSSLKAYKVSGRPDGYLIGRDGELLARIYPEILREQDIRAAIAGKFVSQPVEWDEPEADIVQSASDKPFIDIEVSSSPGKVSMSWSSREIKLRSVPFAAAIARIWDAEYDQVIVDTEPVERFDATLKTGRSNFEQGRELLKSAVQAKFNIRVVPERMETDVYALTLSTSAAAHPKPGAPDAHLGFTEYGAETLFGTVEMPELARCLWVGMRRPVVDETGFKGAFEFDLRWKYGDQTELERLLAAQGLILSPARRTIEFLRVVPAKPPEPERNKR